MAMDSSQRPVDSYWRSRMIDEVRPLLTKTKSRWFTLQIGSDLRYSHVSILKEVPEFVLTRMENKSPIVKHKARMKAICVLESILRRKDDDHFSVVASYFIDNKELVLRRSDSPQASLREKANKVVLLLKCRFDCKWD